MKAVFFDLDGVLFNNRSGWSDLHRLFQTEDSEKIIKDLVMCDYDKAVTKTFELWKDKDFKPYFDLVNSVSYNPGVDELFYQLRLNKSFYLVLLTSSTSQFASRVQEELGFDYFFANELLINDDRLEAIIAQVPPSKKGYFIASFCSEKMVDYDDRFFISDSFFFDKSAFFPVKHGLLFNKRVEEKPDYDFKLVVENNDLSFLIPYFRRFLF